MSRNTRRRRPTLLLVTLLLVAGALGLWARPGDTVPAAAGTAPASPPAAEPAPSEPADPGSPPPGDAADDADEAAAEETTRAPATTAARPPATTTPQDGGTAGPAPVAVSLTYAGWDPTALAVVAGGYAADVVEVDATCTLVLRRGGVELRGEALGTPSAGTTDCGGVRVGGDALTSGTWTAVLGYTSATSAGESAAVEVEIP